MGFFKGENCYNKMTSVRKSCISKSVKKYYLLKSLEISWFLGKNLKESLITYIS